MQLVSVHSGSCQWGFSTVPKSGSGQYVNSLTVLELGFVGGMKGARQRLKTSDIQLIWSLETTTSVIFSYLILPCLSQFKDFFFFCIWSKQAFCLNPERGSLSLLPDTYWNLAVVKSTCIFPAVTSLNVCCATGQSQLLMVHVKGALVGETHCKTVIMLKYNFKSQVDTLHTHPPLHPPNPLSEIGEKSGVNQGLQDQLMWL